MNQDDYTIIKGPFYLHKINGSLWNEDGELIGYLIMEHPIYNIITSTERFSTGEPTGKNG